MLKNFITAVRRSITPRKSYEQHKLFKDPSVHNSLKTFGYCVTDAFIDDNAITELKATYERFLQLHPGHITDKFYATGGILTTAAGKFAFTSIENILVPQLQKITDESVCETRPGVFQIKPPGPQSELIPHRDSALLDEHLYYGVCAWVCLVDSNEQTGALYVLPGSHKYGIGNRSAYSANDLHGMQDVITKYCHVLNAKAGQIVLFDNCLIHGSLNNNSGHVRVAVSGCIFPKQAKLITSIVAQNTPPGTVDTYEVNESYFAQLSAGKDISNLSPLGKSLGNRPIDQLKLSAFEWKLLCRLNRILLPEPTQPRLHFQT